MSTSKTLILNCGMAHLVASIFEVTPGGDLTLDEFFTEPLEYDYANEDSWLPTLLAAIRNIKSGRSLPKEVILIVPGSQLLTKPIRVSSVESDRQQQAIAYEVGQSIPYPLSEVVWGSSKVSDDGVEVGLLVSAMKSSIAERLSEGVSSLGLTPISILPASVLDYNAFRYAYSGADEHTIIMNIGAKSTNLTFVANDDVFVRNLNLGGNTVTQALSDSLGINAQKAEQAKLKFFSQPGSIDSEDNAAKVVKQAVESFIRKISREITLSVATYKRQNSDFKPTRVLLAGAGSQLPGLQDAIATKMKVAVENFDAMQGVQSGSHLDHNHAESYAYQMTETVGAAGGLANPDLVSINLLPGHLVQAMELRKQKPLIVVGAVALAVAAFIPFVKFNLQAAGFEDVARDYQQQAAPLQQYSYQIDEGIQQATAAKDRIQKVESLVNSKYNWINLLVDLEQKLNKVGDVWLDSMTVSRKGRSKDEYRLEISGRMVDFNNPTSTASQDIQNRVVSLLNTLPESNFILSVSDKRFDTSDQGVLKFSFSVLLNPETEI